MNSFLQSDNPVEKISKEFYNNRRIDKISGKNNFGTHKGDLQLTNKNGHIAQNCSMGEQKAMLISLILGQTFALIKETKIHPIILLDEIFVHLDSSKSSTLTDILIDSKSQYWITDTDLKKLSYIKNKAYILELE